MLGFSSLSETPLSAPSIAGQTHLGSVSVSASGALSAIAVKTSLAAASFSSQASLSTVGQTDVSGVSLATGPATLGVTGRLDSDAKSAMSGPATLSATGRLSVPAKSSVSAQASLSSVAREVSVGASVISGSATLAADEVISVVATTTISVSGTLSTKGAEDVAGISLATGPATLGAAGRLDVSAKGAASGQASLASIAVLDVPAKSAVSGQASLSTVARKVSVGASAISGSATLAADEVISIVAATTISVSGNLSTKGTEDVVGISLTTGPATLGVTGRLDVSGKSAVSAQASLASTARRISIGTSTISGSATLAADEVISIVAASAMSASGSLSTKGAEDVAGISLATGPATLGVKGFITVRIACSLSGQATLAGEGNTPKTGASVISASASLSANGQLKISGISLSTGPASLSTLLRKANLGACSLTGSSSFEIDGYATTKGLNRIIFQSKPKLETKPALPIVAKGHAFSDSIIAAWPFYERYSSTVRDTSGREEHLSFNNMDASTDWEVTEKGLALTLDGTNEYLSSEDIELSGSFSFSIWIKPNKLNQDNQAIAGLTDNNNSFYIKKHSPFYFLEGDGGFTDIATRVQYGSWQHVVLTRDVNNVIRLYVNGIKDSNQPVKSGTLYFRGIGKPGSYNGEYLDATITNAILFNRELVSSEVTELKNNPFGPYAAPRRIYHISTPVTIDCTSSMSADGSIAQYHVTSIGAGSAYPFSKSKSRPALPRIDIGNALSQDLVSAWPFYEGAGSVVRDIGPNRNHAEFSSVSLEDDWVVDGDKGRCIDFDGGEWLEVPYDSCFDTDEVTLSAWIKPKTVSGTQVIFHGPDQSYQLFLDKDRLSSWMMLDGSWKHLDTTASLIDSDVWTHVAISYGKNSYGLYVNGEKKNSGVSTEALGMGTGVSYIGSEKGSYAFKGRMSDVKVHNRALPDIEIRELYINPYDIYNPRAIRRQPTLADLRATGSILHPAEVSISCSSTVAAESSRHSKSGIFLSTGPASFSASGALDIPTKSTMRGQAVLSNLFYADSALAASIGKFVEAKAAHSSTANMAGNGVLSIRGPVSLQGSGTLASNNVLKTLSGKLAITSEGALSPHGAMVLLHTGSLSSSASIAALLNIKSNDIVLFTLYIQQALENTKYINRTPDFTSYIDQQLALTLNIDRQKANQLYVDREVEFTLER